MLPAKDAGETLFDAAKSCLAQTFKDFELLLIENDSTPETVEVMNRVAAEDSRVRQISAPARAGFIAALNLGWQSARGRFLARMDADDVCHPERIEKQQQLLLEQPDLSVRHLGANRPKGRGQRTSRANARVCGL